MRVNRAATICDTSCSSLLLIIIGHVVVVCPKIILILTIIILIIIIMSDHLGNTHSNQYLKSFRNPRQR